MITLCDPTVHAHDFRSFCTLNSTGGYPDNPGPDPKHPGGISRRDCTIVAGMKDALCFAFRTDNSGPPVDIQV